jgi:adenosylcobinamide-GDP ribazoletransferase
MAVLHSLRLAFAFLTCVPFAPPQARSDAPHPARGLAFFPLVGAALGAVLVAAEYALHARVAPHIAAVLIVALLAVLTGGLHLDGLADVFDALGGSRGDRARMLMIMRDSRIGAHGAVALCLLLAAKVAVIAELVAHGSRIWLLVCPIVARCAVLPLIAYVPSAREDGLGAGFHAHARTSDVLFATALTLAVLAWAGRTAVMPALAALSCALGFGAFMCARLGGLTGDVHGAAIELAEVTFLVFAVH